MWTGQLVSTAGSALTSLSAGILVYRLTGSALSVGLLLMATGLGFRDPWPPDEPRFALIAQDMFLAGTIVLLLGVLTVIGTFLSDLLLMWVDPRIRYE